MSSMTIKVCPLPKLRVTSRVLKLVLPQWAHPAFLRPRIALSLDDLAREDDVFEVEDREEVIFQLFSRVV